MKILHWVKKEKSGLVKTVGELGTYEEKMGHSISLRTPSECQTIYGFKDDNTDIHCIHSQINPIYYKDGKPKILFLHGEPDYGMMTKISISAIMDLVPLVDCMIAFNEDEAKIWNSFKRTYVIPKGINLDIYKPKDVGKKLRGNPSILYCEHWRTFRHPLHLLVAMERVIKKCPNAKLYLFGCPKEDKDFWMRIINQNRYVIFTPGIFQFQPDMVSLLNLADIVVSPVYPSYGRVSLEALACNKPVVAYNTNPHATYKCQPYNPDDLAEKIIRCFEEKPNGQRKYAEENLSAELMTNKAIEIYRRFLQ